METDDDRIACDLREALRGLSKNNTDLGDQRTMEPLTPRPRLEKPCERVRGERDEQNLGKL